MMNKFTDHRDGQIYKTVELTGKIIVCALG